MANTFQELNLSNAFLFAAALEDPETCRLIIETVLGIPIEHVSVHAEHSMLYSADFRSIRLDIYASDETRVEYNLENSTESFAKETGSPVIRKIHERVVSIKKSRKWEGLYMRFEELLRESAKKGEEEGRKKGEIEGRKKGEEEGKQKTLQLVARMVAAGEADQISRLEEDPEFFKAMLEKHKVQ